MKDFGLKKLYYSISEVSKLTDLEQYILRYWESEFTQLRPSKNRSGKRIYRSNDIRLVLLIKNLLYTEKFTIDGAKKRIREILKQDSQLGLSFNNEKRQKIIGELKSDLQSILALLENRK